MRKQGEPIIREKLAQYIRSLKEEFSQGLILPTKNTVTTTNTQSTNISKPIPSIPLPTNQNKSSSSVVETRDVKIQDTFKCTKVELFQAFCDLDKVKAFTHNSVSLYDCKKGGFFSLFSDNITGRFLDIVPHDRIDMLWRFKSWPSDHYSRVSITFHDDTDQTNLSIQQTGVPVQFYDNTMVC
jgi:activator of HSP90 ATPase